MGKGGVAAAPCLSECFQYFRTEVNSPNPMGNALFRVSPLVRSQCSSPLKSPVPSFLACPPSHKFLAIRHFECSPLYVFLLGNQVGESNNTRVRFPKSDLGCWDGQGWWVLLWCAIFWSKFVSCRRFLVLFHPLVIYRPRLAASWQLLYQVTYTIHRPTLLPTPNIYKGAIDK